MDPKYGTKGNGIDDDHAAIMAALADSQGRQLRVPLGQYKISAPIQIPNGVHVRGDAHDGGGFNGGGCAFTAGFDKDYMFNCGSDGRHIKLENLGFYGWGGCFFQKITHLHVTDCSFGCYRCLIVPECWTSKFANLTFGPGDLSAGGTGLLVWGSAGAMIDTVDASGFDRAVMINGSGVVFKNFRIEVCNRGIVLGETLDGVQNFANACQIGAGTMEASDISIHVRVARFSRIGEVLFQGHEHPGFGADGMCRCAILNENGSEMEFANLTAGGGYADAAYLDSDGGNDYRNSKFARCSFHNGLSVRDDVPSGSLVIPFMRGRQTRMPLWMKPGLLLQDGNANGGSYTYVEASPGAFASGTKIESIGTDTVTLNKPTVVDIPGMAMGGGGFPEGKCYVLFYDSRKIQVGGVYMTQKNLHDNGNIIEQAGYPFEVIP
jgi:hypothetical protein